MTLVELIIAVVLVAMGCLLAAGVAASVQEDARARQTRHTQTVLLAALQAYHEVHRVYPPGDGGPDSTVPLLRALRNTPAVRPILSRLARTAVYQDENGKEYLVDGFVIPLRYDPAGGLGGKRPRLLSLGEDPVDPTDDLSAE